MSFAESFSPNACHIIARDPDKIMSVVDQMVSGQIPHVSFRHILQPQQHGFIVFSAKEKRPSPKVVTMVTYRQLDKPNSQTLSISPTRISPSPPVKFVQRSNQPLCRPNPKLAGEVSKLKQTAEKLSQQESLVNLKQEEPSDSLEDCEIAVIQNFISSMGPQAPHRTQSTTSAFLTDVKDECEPMRKTESVAPKVEHS